MEHQLFKITQNIVLKNKDGKVLILKHTTGNWLLPGGKINKGESSIEGLGREIKEETGADQFKIEKIVDMDTWEENDQGYCVITFLGSAFLDKITLSEEHIDSAWVDINELDKYQFWNEKIKTRIKKALS
jgi:8-oxo-dGTP pyrophosphatase MutT (NUDIX family)